MNAPVFLKLSFDSKPRSLNFFLNVDQEDSLLESTDEGFAVSALLEIRQLERLISQFLLKPPKSVPAAILSTIHSAVGDFKFDASTLLVSHKPTFAGCHIYVLENDDIYIIKFIFTCCQWSLFPSGRWVEK